MDNYTIVRQCKLPSLGKIYGREINPDLSIRSMTTAEEQRRMNPTDRPYQLMADIIDDCLVDKPHISAYDMCLGDYQYLVHQLRIVTYGTSYDLISTCPYCGVSEKETINLEDMHISYYDEKTIAQIIEFDLPKTNHHIRLRMQTPRMLDDIAVRATEIRKKSRNLVGDPAFSLSIESLIDTIDGKEPDRFLLSDWVMKLPMADTNRILQRATKLANAIGIDTTVQNICDVCGSDYGTKFVMTSEFFRPEDRE